MKLDFSEFPVVDAHAHPFMPSREKKVYGRRYILSSDRYRKVEDEVVSSTLSYRMMLMELAGFLGLPEDTPDGEIIAARNELAGQSYRDYVEKLFRNAGIETFLSETGFPVQGQRLRPEEVQAFETATENIDVMEVIRLEMTCNHLVEDAEDKMGFHEFLELFHRHMKERIENGKVAALKTVIGYFTGLEILGPTKQEAERSFLAFYYGTDKDRWIQKPFRDYMVYEFVRLCRQYELPLQIHTGAGDPPSCDLRLMRPSLLYEFMNRSDTGEIPVVLLHGGYPFVEEMAFMVNGYANAWTDVSSMTADDSIAVERALPMLLEKVPLKRLMYGSDGAGDVDPIWFAAVNFKKVLARVLEGLVSRKALTVSYAEKAAAWILSENARDLYHLK